MTTKEDIEVIISLREKDLGGFKVRRVLPFAKHRMVSPFVFFERMGPAEIEPGKGIVHSERTPDDLVGKVFGQTSPVSVMSDLFYAELEMTKGEALTIPSENREQAAYLITGSIRVDNDHLEPYAMAVGKNTDDMTIEAVEDSHIKLIGGKSIGPREIYWNFVSSSNERIEHAKKVWAHGQQKITTVFFRYRAMIKNLFRYQMFSHCS
ncbi:MAG: hypothetical protein H7256_07055 [Bdellovibrio sp.]|nr:hypothetical protein [Bdellovibrio sp.]